MHPCSLAVLRISMASGGGALAFHPGILLRPRWKLLKTEFPIAQAAPVLIVVFS